MTTQVKFAMLVLTSLLVLIVFKQGCQFSGAGIFSEEGKLIQKINQAKDAEERARLITELEGMPGKFVSFGNRWLGIHATRSPGGWDDEGFDHHRTNTPRDIEILTGVIYGVSDIENGGLHQFFGNGTGGMAPEMVEWFERYGLEETAGHLKRTMAVFGETYPRSQAAGNRFLKKFEGKTMDDHVDRIVREVWGFTSLHTELPPVDWEPPSFWRKSR